MLTFLANWAKNQMMKKSPWSSLTRNHLPLAFIQVRRNEIPHGDNLNLRVLQTNSQP